MGKLKLDKIEVKAVKDSIAHWKRDIQLKLRKGVKIKYDIFTGARWVDDGRKVKCYSEGCPLCKVYYAQNCILCPWMKKYGVVCYKQHWEKFINNPCLKTCNCVIKALENILK